MRTTVNFLRPAFLKLNRKETQLLIVTVLSHTSSTISDAFYQRCISVLLSDNSYFVSVENTETRTCGDSRKGNF